MSLYFSLYCLYYFFNRVFCSFSFFLYQIYLLLFKTSSTIVLKMVDQSIQATLFLIQSFKLLQNQAVKPLSPQLYYIFKAWKIVIYLAISLVYLNQSNSFFTSYRESSSPNIVCNYQIKTSGLSISSIASNKVIVNPFYRYFSKYS